MSPWWLALALVLFMEGAVIAIAPRKWQQAMRQMTTLPPRTLRRFGAFLVVLAFLLLAIMLWSRG